MREKDCKNCALFEKAEYAKRLCHRETAKNGRDGNPIEIYESWEWRPFCEDFKSNAINISPVMTSELRVMEESSKGYDMGECEYTPVKSLNIGGKANTITICEGDVALLDISCGKVNSANSSNVIAFIADGVNNRIENINLDLRMISCKLLQFIFYSLEEAKKYMRADAIFMDEIDPKIL